MAKITIVGDAVVVTSTLKFEDIKLVQKVRPKALTVYGEEDGKKVPVFGICTADGKGHISESGISFGGATRDGEGLAQITMGVPSKEGSVKELVADAIGGAVMQLNKLEATLPAVIEEIKAEKTAMLDSIVLA